MEWGLRKKEGHMSAVGAQERGGWGMGRPHKGEGLREVPRLRRGIRERVRVTSIKCGDVRQPGWCRNSRHEAGTRCWGKEHMQRG